MWRGHLGRRRAARVRQAVRGQLRSEVAQLKERLLSDMSERHGQERAMAARLLHRLTQRVFARQQQAMRSSAWRRWSAAAARLRQLRQVGLLLLRIEDEHRRRRVRRVVRAWSVFARRKVDSAATILSVLSQATARWRLSKMRSSVQRWMGVVAVARQRRSAAMLIYNVVTHWQWRLLSKAFERWMELPRFQRLSAGLLRR